MRKTTIANELQRLIQTEGVVAAGCQLPEGELSVVSSEGTTWEQVFQAGFKILDLRDDTNSTKVNMGGFSTVLESHEGTRVAITVLSGHSVVKSLRRMVRGALRRLTGSRVEVPSKALPAVSAAPPTPATRPELTVVPDPTDAGPRLH